MSFSFGCTLKVLFNFFVLILLFNLFVYIVSLMGDTFFDINILLLTSKKEQGMYVCLIAFFIFLIYSSFNNQSTTFTFVIPL